MSVVIKTNKAGNHIDKMPGQKLSFLIQQAGFPMDLQCSGFGICGRCEVTLEYGTYLISGKETAVAESKPLKALACQTEVLSEDAGVFVPEKAILKSEGKIYNDFELCDYKSDPLTRKIYLDLAEATLEEPSTDWERLRCEIDKQHKINDLSCSLEILHKLPLLLKETRQLTVTIGKFHHQWHLIEIEAGDHSKENLAVAVDIGTTTVAAILVDMNTGEILSKASSYNQQMSRADDVASRISVASSSPEMQKYMKDLIINDTINPLITALCRDTNNRHEEILRLAVSGNTVMSHLFLALSPESIGAIPFQPVTNIYADCLGKELGLRMHPCGIVDIVPSISGYIGGDITSDLYVTGMKDTKELTAIIDLGTNSEMVLADNGELFACAAAAGPAFEGAGILCGCRATSGAIEHIDYDSELNFKLKIINGHKAIGICGSAIIDFIANGFLCGLINNMGRFNIELLKAKGKYKLHESGNRSYHCCVVVAGSKTDTGQDIIVTELDLEQILKAKAAVYAGLKTLLSERGYKFEDLKKLILAGGFAKYIRIENAITIGMLPEISAERIKSIGNGSLAGAYLTLLDPQVRDTCVEMIHIPKILPLNMIPDFEMSFVDALMLPNFDDSEFPETMIRLKA